MFDLGDIPKEIVFHDEIKRTNHDPVKQWRIRLFLFLSIEIK